ncbi:hypothetical protein DIPPA_24963 [Diplonema papillatum]|nr:hypothetical protein DIPPA_24963 [Diplonema papillatum]
MVSSAPFHRTGTWKVPDTNPANRNNTPQKHSRKAGEKEHPDAIERNNKTKRLPSRLLGGGVAPPAGRGGGRGRGEDGRPGAAVEICGLLVPEWQELNGARGTLLRPCGNGRLINRNCFDDRHPETLKPQILKRSCSLMNGVIRTFS